MSFKSTLIVTVLVGISGCGLMKPIQATGDYLKSSLAPKGHDQNAWADDESDAWVEEAGREARSDQVRQRDPDRWFHDLGKSEKHRSIERNLGID